MRKLLLTFITALLTATVWAQAPAFPGAEGHGRYVKGGRGGKIVHVTNLNDSGTGSLRTALSGTDAKTIVFDVGGIIALESDLTINSNTTILGQTAPYPGITLRYYTVQPKGDNIILRYLRFRRGEEKDVNDGADPIWSREYTGVILDHCSMSWSIDELASFYDMNNFTMQWCTLGEALCEPGHSKGAHSYGGIWGGKLASFHHNLLLHAQNRTPRFNGARYSWTGYTNNNLYSTYNWANTIQAENVDFRNCVIYNWGNGDGCYGGPGGGYINIVNNYYKAGPATKNTDRVTQISFASSNNSTSGDSAVMNMSSRYFINGNYVTAAGDEAQNYDWKGVKYDIENVYDGEYWTVDNNNFYGDTVEHKTVSGEQYVRIKLNGPCPIGEITTHTAENAYNKVVANAGASLYRDAVDTRYAEETLNGTATYGTNGIIDFVSDQGTYSLESTQRPSGFDSDNDGMPDAWETANGLNPDDASDALTYTLDSKGYYTNLEVYANSLVEEQVKAENADAQTSLDEYYPTCVKTDVTQTYEVLPDSGDNTGGEVTPSVGDPATITWEFSTGAEGQTATPSDNIAAAISSNSVTLGSGLTYYGKRDIAINGENRSETQIQPTEKVSSASESNALTFSFTMNDGYSFRADSVSLYATRFGTDKGKLDFAWSDDGGTTALDTEKTPQRNDADPAYTYYVYDLLSYSKASASSCKFIIYIYSLADNKQVGFRDIKIYGKLASTSGISRNVTIEALDSSDYYNLQGIRVNNPSHGIYIKNGKKIILK